MTQEQWHQVARAEDIPEDGTRQVSFRGEPVCLYNVGGKIYATHDTCTHAQASLADGFLVADYQIECPLHQGTFDIRTGKAVGAPCVIDLRTYVVRLEQGLIFLKDR